MSCFEGIWNKNSQICKYLGKKIEIIIEVYKRILLVIIILK